MGGKRSDTRRRWEKVTKHKGRRRNGEEDPQVNYPGCRCLFVSVCLSGYLSVCLSIFVSVDMSAGLCLLVYHCSIFFTPPTLLIDKCQQSRVGSTVSRVLAALDALDRHHFDKWDDCYNLDILYRKIFEVSTEDRRCCCFPL